MDSSQTRRPRLRRWLQAGLLAAAMVCVPTLAGAAGGGGGGDLWPSAGGNLNNTRFQSSESAISPATVGRLTPKWVFTTGGDVSATPAVDSAAVYVPDWAGNLYAVDRATGAQKWSVKIASLTGVAGDKARATPVISDNTLVIGTLGPFGGGKNVVALDKRTGALLWRTQVDSHPAAMLTQSPVVAGGKVFIGVASQEEALAAFDPGYACCTFRGSFLALDLATGRILWKTYVVPAGFSGGAIWGSSPAVDTSRGQVYIATGNNYTVPQPVLDCVTAAGDDPQAVAACMPADNHFDSILALDTKTGRVRWATRAIPYDAWTVSCIIGDGSNCPQPAGPDYDFGQAPTLFSYSPPSGKRGELVGAGQKSGQYWAVDPDTGAVVWVTQTGPGGTAGGLQWGSAADGRRIYTANANSDRKPWTSGANTYTSGMWSALDAATGAQLWRTAPPDGASTSGPVTTANGVVFGCSLDAQGHMYALNAATGQVLWSFASGGSCLSGAAISRGEVFWGSGYSNFGFGTPINKLYAFKLG